MKGWLDKYQEGEKVCDSCQKAQEGKKISARRKAVLDKAEQVFNSSDLPYTIPEDIVKSGGNSNYVCIQGVCGILTDAGIIPKDYYTNTKFAEKAPGMGFGRAMADLNLMKPGDVLQHMSDTNPEGTRFPSHAEIYKGVNDGGDYEFYDYFDKFNGLGNIRTYSKEELEDRFNRFKNKDNSGIQAQFFSLDPEELPKQTPRPFPYDLPNKEQEDYFNATHAADTKYYPGEAALGPIADADSYKRSLMKHELAGLFNDKKLDKQLIKELKISDQDLQKAKPLIYGIMDQETDFGNPKSTGRSIKYGFKELLGSGKYSMGPAAVRYDDALSSQTKQAFGIDSPHDLSNTKNAYIGALDVLHKGSLYTDNKVLGHPGIQDKDAMERGLYWYNNPKNVVNSDAQTFQALQKQSSNLWMDGYNPETRTFEDRFDVMRRAYNSPLQMSPGSYPDKVLKQSKGLHQVINFDDMNVLPEVQVKDRRIYNEEPFKDGGPVNKWKVSPRGVAANKAARQPIKDIDAAASNALEEVTSYPQRKATELVTGKNQYPAEAMGITNPLGVILANSILDPTNLLGVGEVKAASKLLKGAKGAKKVANATEASRVTDAVSNSLRQHLTEDEIRDWETWNLMQGNVSGQTSHSVINPRNTVMGMPVADWQTSTLLDFPSNWNAPKKTLLGKLKDKAGKAIGVVDTKLGEIVRPPRKLPKGVNVAKLSNEINEELAKGVGVKKEQYPLRVVLSGDLDRLNVNTQIIDKSNNLHNAGNINLVRQTKPYGSKKFSEILFPKQNQVNETGEALWNNTLGYSKRTDFPFQNFPQHWQDKLEKKGISGEYNKAINEVLKRNDLGNVLSGGTGHTDKGGTRWENLIQKGFAEDLGDKYYKLKKDGGWLDKYNDGGPVQPNYNDYSVSAGPDFQGDGYSNVGRNYSPAWGGQFAMGGSLPGATGSMYARYSGGGSMPGDVDFRYPRTGEIPDNGKYAKKTKASAQNGAEMKFYQEGLDFKPKSISKNGSKVIKDDRGQWAHPGEITEIGSNKITMQGVDYPVLGISDTGDMQMMYPNQEYEYDGESVTEYPMAQDGRQVAYVDSVLNANKDLNWVKRLYDVNRKSIMLPGQKDPSTHFMESGDGRVYPTVVEMPNGKLKHLGDKAYDYADSTNTFIQFPDDSAAQWFGKNYKQGTGVLKKKKQGGQLTKLDQLTNFTNYNTKQPGGWLDKYQ